MDNGDKALKFIGCVIVAIAVGFVAAVAAIAFFIGKAT